jgi:hypothetical protein
MKMRMRKLSANDQAMINGISKASHSTLNSEDVVVHGQDLAAGSGHLRGEGEVQLSIVNSAEIY